MTTDYVLVTTTFDNETEARRLAKALVEDRYAACAHIEETDSVYWWDGEVQQSHEWKVEFKTPASRARELKLVILDEHSYDNPQVIVTPIIDGARDYLAWLDAETTPRPPQ